MAQPEAISTNKPLRVALAGNPNAGKSTLFNALTGLTQKIGNYPGVTVDKKTGHFSVDGKRINLIDLPGAYSLNARSQDEQVAVDALQESANANHPDCVIYVADATNLKRNLLFFSQLADSGIKMVLALSMMDLARKQGITIDIALLEKRLGVPVVEVDARNAAGLSALKQQLANARTGTPIITEKVGSAKEEAILRYKTLSQLLQGALELPKDTKRSLTARADSLLTHKVWGYVIFFSILLVIFQAVFAWAEPLMDLIDSGFADLSALLVSSMPDAWYTSLLVDGIVAGLGGILIFVPQIALLFLFVAVLEDTGYMARVSYIMDRLMRKFGLHGRSVIPLISGMACAVPAIMAARTISNWKERMATILVTPFVSCAARLPVYALLIALVVPDKSVGIFNLQGLTLMLLYVLGFVTAIAASMVINRFLKSDQQSFLVLEMPDYHMPRWKDVVLAIWEKVRVFVVDAGKVILAISIVLWGLASFGPGTKFDEIEQQHTELVAQGQLTQAEADVAEASAKLEASYAGHIGQAIEPAIRPLGFDWKIGIALITSFAAREVFTGTMATIYSVESEDDTETLIEQLQRETDPRTGKPKWTFALGISLMLFYAFAMQCMSTLAIVYRETKSLKWPLLQLIFMTGLAYVSSLVAYQLLS